MTCDWCGEDLPGGELLPEIRVWQGEALQVHDRCTDDIDRLDQEREDEREADLKKEVS